MVACDVVVIGGGPAGWAAAAAMTSVGLGVTLVAPASETPWPAVYGAWRDEVDGLDGLDLWSSWRATWPAPVVVGAERHELDRPFGLFDNGRLAATLRSLVEAGGGTVRAGWVVGANHDQRRSTVVLSDGRLVEGRVVVDASGAAAGGLVHRPGRPRPAYQVMAAVVATGGSRPAGAVLLDLSDGPDDQPDPTAASHLDLGDETALVAETSLVRRPQLPADVVAHRLERRLAERGLTPVQAGATVSDCETVVVARPSLAQREVGFGAASGRVHPLAGLGPVLAAAPAVARAVADALVGRRATPSAASRAAWDTVWPPARRQAARYERRGVEGLAALDRGGQRRAVDALFTLDRPLWAGYLAGTLAADDARAVLARLAAAASPRRHRRSR